MACRTFAPFDGHGHRIGAAPPRFADHVERGAPVAQFVPVCVTHKNGHTVQIYALLGCQVVGPAACPFSFDVQEM
ncbi:hypothetical protein GCM10009799_45280 [Nocardiopsis rhodophaea]|uniref:Uncharacterized protein n=1 Tax=Nocardiopsis rhodophaea TaxID=280238 RepID=A0ABN2TJT1_9ACTN